jgi:hypothetical protein
MNLEKVKSLFLKILIGCLIAASAIAVITVLVGHFNDTLEKALLTILLIAIHSLVSFSFIINNEKQETFESLTLFTNTTFFIIILSFITSIFGLWGIFPGSLVGKLYELYFVLLFAALHGEVLSKTVLKQESLRTIVYSNYIFMAIVVAMLLPPIFGTASDMSSFYYRLLAAAGIIDATLTLTVVILHKLYIQKHPDIKDTTFNVIAPAQQSGSNNPQAQAPAMAPKKHMNIFVWLLVAFLVFQFLGAIIVALAGGIDC